MAQSSQHTVVSVDRVINAPAASIFAVVADATRHPEIDGSGQLVKAKEGAAEQLSLGSTFGPRPPWAGFGYRSAVLDKCGPAATKFRIASGRAAPLRLLGDVSIRAKSSSGWKRTCTWPAEVNSAFLI